MTTIRERRPFSYSQDPTVPDFDDRFHLVFMDGDCALCSRGARLIAKLDKANDFRICPIQSPLGSAVLQHYGLDPNNPDSWLYLSKGEAYCSLDAIVRLGRKLGGIGHLLRPFALLPTSAQNWLYRQLAENRYRLFGKEELCAVPDVELQKRIIR